MELPGPPPLPTRKKKRRVLRIVLWAVAIPLLAIFALVSLYFTFDLFTKELPVRETDKELFVRAADLAPYLAWIDVEGGRETMTKERLFDGTYELRYDFEQLDPADPEVVLVSIACSVWTHDSRLDADIGFGSIRAGSRVGLQLVGYSFEAAPELFRGGQRSHCDYLKYDGEIVGNYVLVLQGERLYEWILTGGYFDDASYFDEVLRPVLGRLSAWRP